MGIGNFFSNDFHHRLLGSEDRGGRLNYLTTVNRASKLSLL